MGSQILVIAFYGALAGLYGRVSRRGLPPEACDDE